MHDIEYTNGNEYPEPEYANDELGSERASGGPRPHEPGAIGEAAIAAELLSIGSEPELEHFLGKLIVDVGERTGQLVRPPTGRALGGILKRAAIHALPMLGQAAGSAIVPGIGGPIGGAIGSAAAHAFDVELEGLSSEEQDLERARAFARFAEDAALEAAQADSDDAPPEQVATQAVAAAAERHAPGLLAGGAVPYPRRHHRRHGRWERHGHRIVLFGV